MSHRGGGVGSNTHLDSLALMGAPPLSSIARMMLEDIREWAEDPFDEIVAVLDMLP